jgi:flavin-dependent dehydrogenase
VLVVGDAAGHIDPLTGEGIQYAMDAGEIAARTIEDAFSAEDFSAKFLSIYHTRCMKSFGSDFGWSARMVSFAARNPLFLDAFASLSRRKGDAVMSEWGKIMTGAKPKRHFFMPTLALPLGVEVLRLRRKGRSGRQP